MAQRAGVYRCYPVATTEKAASMKKLFRVLRWVVIVGVCCLVIAQFLVQRRLIRLPMRLSQLNLGFR